MTGKTRLLAEKIIAENAQISIVTSAGNCTGTIAECAAFLANMQPITVRVSFDDKMAELHVIRGQSLEGYQHAIIAALVAALEPESADSVDAMFSFFMSHSGRMQ
jgi:hypothetical protein